jgi:succinoglycan biosynthesis protein ExoU
LPHDKDAYGRLATVGHERELAYVVDCARAYLRDADAVPPDAGLSVPAILEIARFNKLANAIGAALAGVTDLPAALKTGLDSYRMRTLRMNALVLQETLAIEQKLSHLGIVHVFLKGPVQQQRIYGNCFVKPSGDVDILVAPGDFSTARRAITLLGYRVEDRSDSIWWRLFLGEQHMVRIAPGGIAVDLHHRIQQPGSPNPRHVADFIRDRQGLTISGEELPIPSDYDIALLSSISVSKALFNRQACGDYLCDLAKCLARLDEQGRLALLERADAQGLRETLLLAARAARALAGSEAGGFGMTAGAVLAPVADDALLQMCIAPWRKDIAWPARRRVLWELCGRDKGRFLSEAAWAGTAELSRVAAERRVHALPAPVAIPVARSQPVGASPENRVTVIIAAKNAEATIGRAVDSALRQPEVAQVIVVDDGSNDATADAARLAGGERLTLIRLAENKGPSYARNRALEVARCPFVAILDADDFFLDGRFTNLFAVREWDLIADNIVFVSEDTDMRRIQSGAGHSTAPPEQLDLTRFVAGNISQRGLKRGELGFLKPVMRRAFLDDAGLRYNENMRLGEDYDLYARALLEGARFKVIRGCGYAAVMRENSLSAAHATTDLDHLANADLVLLGYMDMRDPAYATIIRHERQTREKYRLRRFLDIKSSGGMIAAGRYAMTNLPTLGAVARGVAADKLGLVRSAIERAVFDGQANALPRFLLPLDPSREG